MSESRTGVLQGSIYPRNLIGTSVTVEVTDEFWGRCAEHSLWVRLDDIVPETPAIATASMFSPSGASSPFESVVLHADSLGNYILEVTGSASLDPKITTTFAWSRALVEMEQDAEYTVWKFRMERIEDEIKEILGWK